MKKPLLLIMAILFACQITNAQTQKGLHALGGNVGYTHSTATTPNKISYPFYSSYEEKITNDNVSIGPSYGYFIADGAELGGVLTFTNATATTQSTYSASPTSTAKQITNTYGVNVFFRKYLLHDNKIGVRVGPYAVYNFNKNKVPIPYQTRLQPANHQPIAEIMVQVVRLTWFIFRQKMSVSLPI